MNISGTTSKTLIPDIWQYWIQNYSWLRNRAIYLTKGNIDDADDLVSSTAIKVFSYLENNQNRIREPCAFFLHALRNEFINHYRRNCSEKRWLTHSVEAPDQHPAALHAETDTEKYRQQQDVLQDLFRVLPILSCPEQKLFNMRFCKEQSYEDIASDLNISQPLVRKRIQLLREKIISMSRYTLEEIRGCFT